jgi:hypothetical protein
LHYTDFVSLPGSRNCIHEIVMIEKMIMQCIKKLLTDERSTSQVCT